MKPTLQIHPSLSPAGFHYKPAACRHHQHPCNVMNIAAPDICSVSRLTVADGSRKRPPPRRMPDPRRLLVVDKQPALLGSLTDLLIAAGYVVLPAANGQEVLGLARQVRVDLALLDLDVLASKSRKVFRRLVREKPNVPVIFATARQDRVPAELRNGAGKHLEKPIHVPKLLRTIKTLLRRVPGLRDRSEG